MVDVASTSGAEPNLDQALEQLRAFAAVFAMSVELRNVLASPAVAAPKKRALVASLGERIGLQRPVRNLLFVMLDHRRLPILEDVIDALEKARDERRGVERLEVTSALPMTEDQRLELLERFRAATGKQVEASFAEDARLLGGAVIRRGGTVLDGSLASQLQSLSRAMTG